MVRRVAYSALMALSVAFMPFLGRAACGQEKSGSPAAEYKAVRFGTDEKENTKTLNDLAADGWEYVGPLGNSMVAFKRDRLVVAIKKELAKWEGDYVVDGGGSFTVKGDRWTMKAPGEEGYSGKVKILEVREGLTVADLVVEEGTTKGKTVKAIFRLDGDTLHYCGTYDLDRPSEFKGDSDPYYYAWKRVK